MWQNIWQILLFIRLFPIKEYASLFDFLPQMKGYSASLFIRFLYNLIQMGSVTIVSGLHSLRTALTIWGCLFIVGCVLLFISRRERHIQLLEISHILLFIWTLICVVCGISSTSLQAVIHILHTLSIGGILLEILCIYSVLHNIREKIQERIEL